MHQGEKRSGTGRRSNKTKSGQRPYMSVSEMGKLLGLKKTDRYWLVHKQVFETRIIHGKMWVSIPSFEKWYANQVKYRKVTGEEPGAELKTRSYSIRDVSGMIGICEQGVYELIKRDHIETVTVDYWMRIPREAFDKWYRGQHRYRTKEDREKDAQLEEASVTMPEMARLLGTTRQKVYSILADSRYRHFFEFIVIGGRKRITKESLQRFLDGQDIYHLVSVTDDKENEMTAPVTNDSETDPAAFLDEDNPEQTENRMLISLQDAAKEAGISRQALSKHMEAGSLGQIHRYGRKLMISKRNFNEWMQLRSGGGN